MDNLPLSPLGGIMVIKMSTLPHILYLMQITPNVISRHLYEDLHIGMHFQYYHWEIQLKNISEWVIQDSDILCLDTD